MKFDVGDLITFTYYFSRFPSSTPVKGYATTSVSGSKSKLIQRTAIALAIDHRDNSATVLMSNNDEKLKEYAVYSKDIIKVVCPYNKLIEGL